jgi:ABC-type transport system substrate-binding protein
VPNAIEWEDLGDLTRANPDLQYVEFPGSPPALWYRVDKPDLPIYDVNVMRALNMAVDNWEILDTYYGGKADILAWPVMPYKTFKDSGAFIELEDLPESCQKLFGYHPEEAKQLMIDAGYPDGFRTEVNCYQPDIDLLSVVADSWKKVLNVDMEMKVAEYSVYNSIMTKKTYPEMHMGTMGGSKFWYKFMATTPGNKLNYCMVNDPTIEEMRVPIIDAAWDSKEQGRLMSDLYPHMVDLALALQFPAPFVYNAWQPWVRDYGGERQVGYINPYFNWARWIWYDSDMKEEMTGRR